VLSIPTTERNLCQPTVTLKDMLAGAAINKYEVDFGDGVIDLIVIYAGQYAFRQDGIAVIPLALLGP
jgi:hypothetical protein